MSHRVKFVYAFPTTKNLDGSRHLNWKMIVCVPVNLTNQCRGSISRFRSDGDVEFVAAIKSMYSLNEPNSALLPLFLGSALNYHQRQMKMKHVLNQHPSAVN